MEEDMKFTEDPKELKKVVDTNGYTVAHEQAKYGQNTNNINILKLKDNKGWSVAHVQACKGWTTEDHEILKLKTNDNNNGYTVAHVQAWKDWTTDNPKILKLKTNKGTTVLSLMLDNSNWEPPEDIKDIIIDGKTIWEYYADKQLELL